MKLKKKIGLVGFLVFSVLEIRGAEAEPTGLPVLSLSAALERSVEQSMSLAKSTLDLNTAKIAADNLWAQIFPGISAGGSLGYGTSFSSPRSENEPSFGLQTSITFSLNPGLKSSMKIITLAYQSAILNYESSKKQLELSTAKTYYGLLVEQKNLSVLKEKLSQTERQLEQTRIRFQNGFTSELDLQRSRLAVESSRFDLSRSELLASDNLRSFLSLLDYDEKAVFALENIFVIQKIELDADALLSRYLQSRPDMIRARQNIEKLELQRTQKIMQSRAPSLSLSSRWSGTPSMSKPFSDSLSMSAGISIPLDSWIPASKDAQAIGSANTELEKAKIDLKESEKNARISIRTMVNNLSNSWRSIEIARLRVDLAGRAYQMARLGFENGSEEYLALETARNDLTTARQQLLNEELSYKNTSLDLAAALNISINDLDELCAVSENTITE